MLRSSVARWAAITALTAALELTGVASAHAAAAPVRFSDQVEPFVEQFGPGDDLCFASGGEIAGTDTYSGIHFQTDQIFHISIRDLIDYTIHYDDPALPEYTGHAIAHFTFNGQLTPGSDTIVMTSHTTDRATAPDGTSVVVHEIAHGTVLDTEPPDPSPGDVVHVSFDRVNVSCPQ